MENYLGLFSASSSPCIIFEFLGLFSIDSFLLSVELIFDSNGNPDFWWRMKVSDGTESILSPNSRSGGGKVTGYRSLHRRRTVNREAGRRRRIRVGSGLVATPLRQWKFHDRVPTRDFIPAPVVSVSARKIAAGLWQIASTAGGARWRYGLFHRLGLKFNSLETPKYVAMEGATKWECGYLKVHTATFSVAATLQVELVEARNRIKELEAERRFSRMKLESLTRKLDEGRALWIRRERQKMSVIVDHLKQHTIREKRKFRKMDILNSKLLSNLAYSKKSAKQFMQNYEKEKRGREFLKEVCNDLAKEIDKEKAEIGALKSERGRVLEKVEEERKMLQLVEAWHEEHVQMKLVNAKLIFEEKYSEMSNIIADIETFLRSSNVNTDMTKKSQVEIQGINKFSSMPPKPDYIHTIIEDSKVNEAKGRGVDRCISRSPISHSSCITRSTTNMYSSEKKAVIQAEDQNLEEFEQSVNDTNGCKYISSGKPEDDHSEHHESRKFEFSDTSSVLSKKLKKKGSSTRKLWRTSNDGNAKLLNGSSSNVSSRNPHIVRAMQGRIEWRQGIQRQGLRAEGLEARLVNQKMQLRSVLKQRSQVNE
ncbi:hypothetical protein Fot_39147 [Forsythia ovata]|uniref:Uncharacterized protein n=1 Tax=Forsythia ovata TaxID=205694 RepID=A0ABD1S3X4_9LAMI